MRRQAGQSIAHVGSWPVADIRALIADDRF
jgi:hypothetical protein